MRTPLLGLLLASLLSLGCPAGASRTAPGSSTSGPTSNDRATEEDNEVEVEAEVEIDDFEPEERDLDPRLSPGNLRDRLTPYIKSIGAGFGPAYQASGVVLVAAAGQTLYEESFGSADYARQIPHGPSTAFRIGGLGKQFTAAAILKLVDRGKLELDAPLQRYLPQYPSVGHGITLHHLLSHTSGLPGDLPVPDVSPPDNQPLTTQQRLETFWTLPLEFEPGTDFRFSDAGYAVLEAVIEAVTKRSYAEHMQRALFGPHRLTDTTVDGGGTGSPQAVGYRADAAGGREPAPAPNRWTSQAEVGLRSSARDLLRWSEVLRSGHALSDSSKRLLETEVRNNHAYGWFVRQRQGIDTVAHAGAVGGFVSSLIRAPTLDLTIIVLSNNSAFDAAPLAEVALRCALGQRIAPRKQNEAIALDPEVAARIVGTYQLSEAAIAELKRRKIRKKALGAMRSIRLYEQAGRLFFKPIGQSAVVMTSTATAHFVLMGGKASIDIPLGPDDSEATRLVLRQGPLELEYTRKARVRGKQKPAEEHGPPGHAQEALPAD